MVRTSGGKCLPVVRATASVEPSAEKDAGVTSRPLRHGVSWVEGDPSRWASQVEMLR
jgi:hypothetical protein